MAQIHEYMLSKAPPVPQLSSSESSEEPSIKEIETPASSQAVEVAATNEGHLNPEEVGRNVEEIQEVPPSANPSPAGVRASTEVPARTPSEQHLQNPETRVQKPADDRLFTWAAVGLTIAILVLLLKKYMKASGHGAVFMNGS